MLPFKFSSASCTSSSLKPDTLKEPQLLCSFCCSAFLPNSQVCWASAFADVFAHHQTCRRWEQEGTRWQKSPSQLYPHGQHWWCWICLLHTHLASYETSVAHSGRCPISASLLCFHCAEWWILRSGNTANSTQDLSASQEFRHRRYPFQVMDSYYAFSLFREEYIQSWMLYYMLKQKVHQILSWCSRIHEFSFTPILSFGASPPCSFQAYEQQSGPVCNPGLLHMFPAWHHWIQELQPPQDEESLDVNF